jgi:6-phosphogluconolactonase
MKVQLLLFTVLIMGSQVFAQQKQFMLVGTYTSGSSQGIYVYEFDSATGKTILVDSIATTNPSFLTSSATGNFVYAVNEDAGKQGGKVSSFSFNKKTGQLSLLNEQPSMGDHPCYITLDKTGKWVTVGNYTGGNLAVLPVQADGTLGKPATVLQHKGSSVNANRQKAPHVHATVFSPDNKFLLVADLGMDKITVYAFDEKTGSLTAATDPAIAIAPGSGPRHLAFHPNSKWLYLINELSGDVIVFDYNSGTTKQIQTISTIPTGVQNPSSSAEITVSADGKFLYASNRNPINDIAIFSIDQKAGTLTNIGFQSTLGRGPRHFTIDPSGRSLVVANQNSNSIVIFNRDVNTGLLTYTGQSVQIADPVCIEWMNN